MSVNSRSRSQRIGRLCVLVLVAVSVGCGLYAVTNGWVRLHIRQQLDYEEGNVLNAAVLITHGQSPYAPPNGWPVVINPYGPVPYYLAAIPIYLRGVDFAGPRTLVLLSCVLCALFAGLIARRVSASALAGLIAAALFLSHSLVQYWMVTLRVDLIGLALTLAGFCVFLYWSRAWPVAIVLFTAAMFTKPTFVAAPLACLLFLLAGRQFRKAVLFATTGVILGLVLLLAMQWRTHGAFWFDVFDTHPDPWRLSHYLQMFRYFVYGNVVLVAVGLVAFVSSLLRRNFDLLTLYAISAVLATFSAGKLGSNDNHLLELTAVLCILASAALVRWTASPWFATVAGSAACVAIAGWLLLQIRFLPTAAPQAGCTSVYSLVRQWPGERILSEDVGALVLAGKPVWVSNPFVYGQLTSAGKWSGDPVAQRVRSRWFDLIVLSEDASVNTDRWGPELRQSIAANYRLAATFRCEGAKAAYVPKRDPPPQP